MNDNKRIGMVYSHTHWDREWRATFQEYRIGLIGRIDYVIDLMKRNPDFTSFHLDGQTIILEDYLEIRPENEQELKKLISAGRLLAGPWYLLPDMFLPSGEAIVRNLQRGIRIAEKFGRTMEIMYIPDMFGQMSQTPQIASLLGLKGAIIWRGIHGSPEELPAELDWEGADGTHIPTIRLHNDYGYTYIGYVKDGHANIEHIRDHILKTHLPYCNSKHILLPDGGDHASPDENLPLALKEWNKSQPDIELRLSTLEEFFDAVLSEKDLKWHPIKGEQRMTGKNFDGWQALLTGTLSSRIYLKQKNYEVQRYLERVAEPVSVMAWLSGGEYPAAFLDKSWQYLLTNHAHDSICGCSLDEVHRDMEYRYAQAEQIARRIAAMSARHVGGVKSVSRDPAPKSVSVFNGLPYSRSGEVKMRIRNIPEEQVLNSHLEDENGNSYEIYVEESGFDNLWEYSDIRFNAPEIPAMGYANFVLVPGKYEEKGPVASDNSIENEFLKVEVNKDGTISLLDKRNNQKYDGLNRFEDREDVGDGYNYSYSREGYAVYSGRDASTKDISTRLERSSCGQAVLCIDQTLMVPSSIEPDRKKRSSHMVPLKITSKVSLGHKDDYISVETEVDNTAKDHRLRVMFPSQVKTDTVWADGQFDVLERSVILPDTTGWKEEACGQQPQKNFVDVYSDGRGLAIFNRGLPEYEVADDEDRTIYLTLLRGVDAVSRGDLETRKRHAAAYHYVPEAQCLGKMRFQYAIHPHSKPWWEADIARKALVYNTSLEAIPVKEVPEKRSRSFISVDGKNIMFSAAYVDRGKVYLRIYNPSAQEEDAIIKVTDPDIRLLSAAIVDLRHRTLKTVDIEAGSIQLQVAPKKIVTLELCVGAEV